jgi:hypothetical protein
MNFEDIQDIDGLEIISKEVVWQNFERLVAFMLEENDFRVQVNTVKVSNKKRRQFDVIARKGKLTLLVECKKWAGSRYRLSALKRAIERHKERTAFYKGVTEEDAIPIIVTLIEEEIQFYECVPIVPICKLNSFLNELDKNGNECPFDCLKDDNQTNDDCLEVHRQSLVQKD